MSAATTAPVKPALVKDVERVGRVLKLNERARVARLCIISDIGLVATAIAACGMTAEIEADGGWLIIYAARRTRRATTVKL